MHGSNFNVHDTALAGIIGKYWLHDTPEKAGVRDDWSALVQSAARNRVIPLLYVALKTGGWASYVPPKIWAGLEQSFLRSFHWSEKLHREMSVLVDLFDSRGIRAVFLKGGVLGPVLYGNPALRQMGDIDFLVAREDVFRAENLMLEIGYAPEPTMFGRKFIAEELAEKCLRRRSSDGSFICADLHWNIINLPGFTRRIDPAWLVSQTESVMINGRRTWMFNPTAQLLHLCLHHFFHHKDQSLNRTFDVAILLKKEGHRIDWAEVTKIAAIAGFRGPLAQLLNDVEATWKMVIPSEASSARALDAKTENVWRRQQKWLRSGWRVCFLAVSTRRPWVGICYLFQAYAHSPDYMKRRFRFRTNWALPYYYGVRLGRGVRRFLSSKPHHGNAP